MLTSGDSDLSRIRYVFLDQVNAPVPNIAAELEMHSRFFSMFMEISVAGVLPKLVSCLLYLRDRSRRRNRNWVVMRLGVSTRVSSAEAGRVICSALLSGATKSPTELAESPPSLVLPNLADECRTASRSHVALAASKHDAMARAK